MTLAEFQAQRRTLTRAAFDADPRFQPLGEMENLADLLDPDTTHVHLYWGFCVMQSPRGFTCEWHHGDDTILPTLAEAETLILADYLGDR